MIKHKETHVCHFPFDIKKALKSGWFLSGTSGSGKTNLAYQLADRLIKAGVVVYVFDPSQAWKKFSNIKNWIQVRRGEYKLRFPKKESVIFDISHLYVPEQREFVESFCRSLFIQRTFGPEPDHWIFLIFEEAQIYLHQHAMRSKAYQEVMRLITVGRNPAYKIRFGLITQFAATVDKLCVKMTEQRYFGYSDELNDKKYLQNFVGKENIAKLDTLKVGEFLYDVGKVTKHIKTPLFQSKTKPKQLAISSEAKSEQGEQVGELTPAQKGLLVLILVFVLGLLIMYAILTWGLNATGM